MLKAAATYQKVFDRYGDDDPQFAIELNSEKAPGVPEAVDWEYARKISEFLEHFYNLIVLRSKHSFVLMTGRGNQLL